MSPHLRFSKIKLSITRFMEVRKDPALLDLVCQEIEKLHPGFLVQAVRAGYEPGDRNRREVTLLCTLNAASVC